MTTREELRVLSDQLPEPRLEVVRRMLELHMHSTPQRLEIENLPVPTVGGRIPLPDFERTQRLGQSYREQVLRRFRESRRPGTLSTGGGTGFLGEHEGVPFGRHGFHYWDDKALVHQSLQNFDGQEIELMERLSFSPDCTKLRCSLEIASGGQSVQHEDEFPVTRAQTQA
jgi:hypothetical protein